MPRQKCPGRVGPRSRQGLRPFRSACRGFGRAPYDGDVRPARGLMAHVALSPTLALQLLYYGMRSKSCLDVASTLSQPASHPKVVHRVGVRPEVWRRECRLSQRSRARGRFRGCVPGVFSFSKKTTWRKRRRNCLLPHHGYGNRCACHRSIRQAPTNRSPTNKTFKSLEAAYLRLFSSACRSDCVQSPHVTSQHRRGRTP
jgi:hypothetical protein